MNASVPKPVIWMGDALARLQTFPSTVQDEKRLAWAAALDAAEEY